MKFSLHEKGYLLVSIKGKRYGVHQIIAKYFLENPYNLPQVDHKNTIKTDNRMENLEWVTQSVNMQRSYNNGTHLSKLKNYQILEIRDYASKNPHIKQNELAKMWNTDQPTISRILSKQRRKSI